MVQRTSKPTMAQCQQALLQQSRTVLTALQLPVPPR